MISSLSWATEHVGDVLASVMLDVLYHTIE